MSKTRIEDTDVPMQTESAIEQKEQKETASRETTNPLLAKLKFIENHKKHAGLGANASYFDKLFWSPGLKTWLYYYPEKASHIIANLNRRWIKGLREVKKVVPETIFSAAKLKLKQGDRGDKASFVFLKQAPQMQDKFITEPDEFITKFLAMNATIKQIEEFRAVRDLSKVIKDKSIEQKARGAYNRLYRSTPSPTLIKHEVEKKETKETDATMEPETNIPSPVPALSHSADTSRLPKPARKSTAVVLSIFSQEQKDRPKRKCTEKKSQANPELLSAVSQQKFKRVTVKRNRAESDLIKLDEMVTELSVNIEALCKLYNEKSYEKWKSRLQKTKKLADTLSSTIDTLNIGTETISSCYSALGLTKDALDSLPLNMPKDDKGSDQIKIALKNAPEFCQGLQEIVNQAINPKHNFSSSVFHEGKNDYLPKLFYDNPALDRQILADQRKIYKAKRLR